MNAHVDPVNASSEILPGRPSRRRLLSLLRRWSAPSLQIRNHAYSAGPTLIADEQVLIWQETGLSRVTGELACRLGDWSLFVAADNLARIEPRLEGLESFLPAEVFAALIENAMAPVLDHLERLAGIPIDGVEFHRRAAPASLGDDDVRVGFQVFDLRQAPLMRGWVRMPASAWLSLDFSRAPVLPSSRDRVVPIRLIVRIASCRLLLADVLALQQGDALRTGLPAASVTDSLPVLLTDSGAGMAPRFQLQARLRGDEIFLENLLTTDSNSPLESQAVDAPSVADDIRERLAEIECDVSFELGTLRMTVGEVARMRSGQTMRLGVRLQDQPVGIMVNGRLLARGELAMLGDELVVVVTDTHKLPQV